MKYRALDSKGDYSFGKSMQNFLLDAKAVAQAIRTNLLLLQGEWWEDTGDGLPLFQSIIGQLGIPDRLSTAELLIKERILSTQGVVDILSFESSYEDRKYTMTNVTVTTNRGQIATVSGVTF